MRELLLDLLSLFTNVCPTFITVPSKTAYPYITLEPELVLLGLPWGPQVVTFSVKVWSRYAGTHEILKLAKAAEDLIQNYEKVSLKIRESSLVLLKDGQTRLHTFQLKALLKGVSL